MQNTLEAGPGTLSEFVAALLTIQPLLGLRFEIDIDSILYCFLMYTHPGRVYS